MGCISGGYKVQVPYHCSLASFGALLQYTSVCITHVAVVVVWQVAVDVILQGAVNLVPHSAVHLQQYDITMNK